MNENHKTRILVVEDEPVQAMKLQFLLEEQRYAVDVVCNGREGFEKLCREHSDLVISDIQMPEMDGYELCRKIKSTEETKQTLVILLTSHSEPGDVISGLAHGADNFVIKPYDPLQLLSVVNQLFRQREELAEPRNGSKPIIHFQDKDFVVDASREQMLNFFLSAYQSILQKQKELEKTHAELKLLAGSLERKVEQRTAALRDEIAVRKRAEEEGRERAALLDKAQDAIMVADVRDHAIYWNRSAARMYGWSADEVMGKTFVELLHDASHPLHDDALLAMRSRGEWLGELRQRTKEGKEIIVQSSWTLVRDDTGKHRATLIINTDITEKKKLEAQFLRTQRMGSIGTLAGGIAHDLNNLLAPILLSVNILQRSIKDENTKHMLSVVASSARRAADMLGQVLTFARGVEGERVALQPGHIIREMQTIAGESFPKAIELSVDCPRDLFMISADATQLHQVLMNLCVNARDAMPRGGTIRISSENLMIDENYAAMNPEAKPGPYVLIRVRDTGTGIPREIIEKIFEPFFTTKEVGKGTGLGLSTVQAIVRSHGGFIRVQSEPGTGTEFRVYLPAVPQVQAQQSQPGHSRDVQGHGQLVLVVDDEYVIREITRITLEGNGYRVITASDGIEALALYAQRRSEVDAVITDMVMPVLDGISTIRALLKMDPAVKIVAVSGQAENEKSAQAAFNGRVPFLCKPYTSEQMLAVLATLLAGPEEAADALAETPAADAHAAG